MSEVEDRPCVVKSHTLQEVTLLNWPKQLPGTKHGGSRGAPLEKKAGWTKNSTRDYNGEGLFRIQREYTVRQLT